MAPSRLLPILVACLPLLIEGCAVVSNEESFKDIQGAVKDRANIQVSWTREEESSLEIKKRIEELLRTPLTAEKASELALINNKRIQATYEELGVARAELIQAGLLRNPLLEVRPRFASGGGGTNVELGLSEPIFDVLFIPLRKRIAENQLESVKAAIAHEVISNISNVKKAFYELQAALQMLEVRESILSSSEASYFTAKKIHDAGNTTTLKLGNQKALFEEAKIEKLNAEGEVKERRELLSSMMGLDSSTDSWEIHSRLDIPPKESLDSKSLEDTALVKNMELISSREAIDTLRKELGLSSSNFLSNGEIGVSSERDIDGGWVTGPNLLIPLPIVDQGQGYIARTTSELNKRVSNYEAMIIEKRANIRATLSQMEKARAKALLYRDEILPLRRELTEETQTRYDSMLVGVFDLLLAKQSEIQAGANYIEALKEYWIRRSELEKEVGVQLSVNQQAEPSEVYGKISQREITLH